MKSKKNTPAKTPKELRAYVYRCLERHNEQITTHPSIQRAIDESVDLRDVNDNLETLIRDAMEAQILVKWLRREG